MTDSAVLVPELLDLIQRKVPAILKVRATDLAELLLP